jgi:hypothetical protein
MDTTRTTETTMPTSTAPTRHDLLDHEDPRAVLRAWVHGTVPMGAWPADDEAALHWAVADELLYALHADEAAEAFATISIERVE